MEPENVVITERALAAYDAIVRVVGSTEIADVITDVCTTIRNHKVVARIVTVNRQEKPNLFASKKGFTEMHPLEFVSLDMTVTAESGDELSGEQTLRLMLDVRRRLKEKAIDVLPGWQAEDLSKPWASMKAGNSDNEYVISMSFLALASKIAEQPILAPVETKSNWGDSLRAAWDTCYWPKQRSSHDTRH